MSLSKFIQKLEELEAKQLKSPWVLDSDYDIISSEKNEPEIAENEGLYKQAASVAYRSPVGEFLVFSRNSAKAVCEMLKLSHGALKFLKSDLNRPRQAAEKDYIEDIISQLNRLAEGVMEWEYDTNS